MIHLISVDHMYQYLPPDADAERVRLVQGFMDYLEDVVTKVAADPLAEEFSVEALAINNAKFSNVQMVAGKLRLKHLFCDPTTDERTEHHIANDDFLAREQYWLQQLLGNEQSSIVFLCGNDHIHSFNLLLQQSPFQARIQAEQWGEKQLQHYRRHIAMRWN